MINLGKLYEFEGWDPSYKVIFHANWSDWEESGWVAVMERNGKFYEQRGGYSVMCEDNTDRWDPWEVTQEQALETMLEWAEHEDFTGVEYEYYDDTIG